MYLPHSLKDGTARHIIEGLSGLASEYEEAIKCLQKRYDKPCLLHLAHVKAIVEVPSPKEGSSKELWHLHHSAASICGRWKRWVMIHPGLSLCRWSRRNSIGRRCLKGKDTPKKAQMCLTTQRSWSSSTCEWGLLKRFSAKFQNATLRQCIVRLAPRSERLMWRAMTQPASSAVLGNTGCTGYVCRKFKSMLTEKCMNLVRKDKIYFNCLQSGHFTQQCTSDQKCRECLKTHHTLLHLQFECEGVAKTPGRETKQLLPAKTEESSASHSSHLSCPKSGVQRRALMMACQIGVVTSDSHVMKAWALLDCASSTSFVIKHLARWLQLPRQCQRVRVAGMGGPEHSLSSRSVVTLTVANQKSVKVGRLTGPRWKVEAAVLPQITTRLPAMQLSGYAWLCVWAPQTNFYERNPLLACDENAPSTSRNSQHHPSMVIVGIPTTVVGRSVLAQSVDWNSPGGHIVADLI